MSDLEVIEAEDGTPSLGMPVRGGWETIVVCPEPEHPGLFAILFTHEDGIEKIGSKIPANDLYAAVMRRLCPW